QPTLQDRERSREAAGINTDLGLHYLANNNLEQARMNLNRALELDDRYAPAHSAFALLQVRLNNPREAERAFRRSLELDPDDSFTWNSFGSFLCQTERFDEAQEAFDKALGNPFYLSPEQALTNSGVCLQEEGKVAEAEERFRLALDNNPQYLPALLEMARLTFDDERYLQTRAYLQRFRDHREHTAETLWLCYQAETALGNREGAGNCAVRLKDRFPDSRETAQLLELERRGR
ncbi:type IV pilus biogenesis/stability protein PilW, partial [Thioalkalivibrio denitrificans]